MKKQLLIALVGIIFVLLATSVLSLSTQWVEWVVLIHVFTYLTGLISLVPGGLLGWRMIYNDYSWLQIRTSLFLALLIPLVSLVYSPLIIMFLVSLKLSRDLIVSLATINWLFEIATLIFISFRYKSYINKLYTPSKE